ncbi:MAG: hypothetical protein KDD53_05465 [Bdellovibrionales bacterium]|nr:hypothetical protein [Bdellovibrionales bacterium]
MRKILIGIFLALSSLNAYAASLDPLEPVACSYDSSASCVDCRSNGKYKDGRMPDTRETPQSPSFGCEGGSGEGLSSKPDAIADLLSEFGISPGDLCEGTCKDGSCVPSGLVNPAGDGIRFNLHKVPMNGIDFKDGAYCFYTAEIVDSSKTPQFKASGCDCDE